MEVTASTAATGTSVASVATPKTPGGSNTTPSSKQSRTETPSPGNWAHPRIAEITRRRKASTFDGSNVVRITWNLAALLASFVAHPVLQRSLPFVLTLLKSSTASLAPYQSVPIYLIRLTFLFNIFQALTPLWSTPDPISDIPLTPQQRRLLGLSPSSGKPNTPQSQYITPPKYQRLTPRSQSPAWPRNQGASGSGAHALNGVGRDSFSPSSSPLWSQNTKRDFARGNISDSEKQLVGGVAIQGSGSSIVTSDSPARNSLKESSGIWAPSSPSPAGRAAASGVGLNSKWLYERGRSTSGSRKSFGGA